MKITRDLLPVLLVVSGAMAAATGCSTDPGSTAEPTVTTASEIATTPRAESGPVTVAVADPVHDRTVDVAVWSPAGAQNQHFVVISHGFAGDATSHAPLASRLAGAGYTVAAPTHPDLAGLQSTQPGLDPLTLRPRHISLTIDHLEAADGPFDSVTVVGHSLGSYTALRLIGADPSGDGLDDHCGSHPQDPVLCTPNARARFDALPLDSADAADDRIDHVVLLAPGYGPLFSIDDLAMIDVPVMVVEADSDGELPGGQVAQLVGRLPNPATDQSIPGSHYVFLRNCTAAEAATLPELCTEAAGVDRDSVAAQLAVDIDAFIADT